MSRTTIRFLSSEDVYSALPMKEAIAAMRKAFVMLSDGEAVMPQRTSLPAPKRGGSMLFMPTYLPSEDSIGIKLLSLFSGNAARGLPYIQSLMILYDGTTGGPLAIMDGTSLTAIRTGAASGAATAALARPDAACVAVFGAGAQGRTQLEGVCSARPIAKASIYDINEGAAGRFAAEMSRKLGIAVEAAASPARALRAADIVCTATVSRTPVFSDADLNRGTHINAVGSFTLDSREIPGETVARSRIFVDHRESALSEAGDLMIPFGEGLIGGSQEWTELGETLSGRREGRRSEGELTFFKSVGVGIQDLIAANAVLERSVSSNLGTIIEWN